MTESAVFPPPSARSVLVLAPHPDDETLGCGGTLALYREQGVDVHVAFVTDGEAVESEETDVRSLRQAEARRAAAILGVRNLHFLALPDGEVSAHADTLEARIAELLQSLRPDLVFAPYPLDPHADHVATAGVALRLMLGEARLRLAFYEVYQPIRYNREVDISTVLGRKKDAIGVYETALLGCQDVVAFAMDGLAKYRSFFNRIQRCYEAFWLVDSPPSEHELLAWVTYDYSVPRSVEVFRSKLREIDFLTREAQQTIAAGRARVASLEAENQQLRSRAERLEQDYRSVVQSAPWRLVQRYAGWRDAFFPAGTRRRRLYNRLIRGVKRVS